MRTLFMDTHAEEVIYALYVDDQLQDKIEVRDSKERSAICIPTLVSFLDQNHLDIHDIQDIVVVNGPGSFTGERIGVTIAKTLAYTLNIPIRTITSLEMYFNQDLVKDYDYLLLNEKNGYYIGTLSKDKLSIVEYQYMTLSEYQNWNKKDKCLELKEINYRELIHLAHQKDAIKAHAVKPLYIKKIGVEQ